MIDFIIILVVLALVIGGVGYKKHLKKSGQSSCGCNCNDCSSSCSSRE